jgi:hypothetical protein
MTSRKAISLLMGLLLVCVITAMLSACQSIQYRSTDEVVVKKMLVNGTELSYVEEGKGDTVVFVHGASGDWRTWEELRPIISKRL